MEGVGAKQPLNCLFWDEGFDDIRELPKKNRDVSTCLNKKRFEGAKRKLLFDEMNPPKSSKRTGAENQYDCLVCSETFADQRTLVEHFYTTQYTEHSTKYGHKCFSLLFHQKHHVQSYAIILNLKPINKPSSAFSFYSFHNITCLGLAQ